MIDQEARWKSPLGWDFAVLYWYNNEWAWMSDYIENSAFKKCVVSEKQAYAWYNGMLGSVEKAKMVKVSRYMTKGSKIPLVTEVLKYYEKR